MIARNGLSKLEELLSLFPVLALVGARQTGKTTLVRYVLPSYSYVTLDLPSEAALAETDPDLFFSLHPAPVIIDEVQYAPALFRHLKARVDADRHDMGRYVITGSQKFGLMKALADSLAGRVGVMSLEGLSYSELRVAGFDDLYRWLGRGGFPELWRVPGFPSNEFYSSYMATYLERDVRQLLNVGDLRDFERFIRVLAVRHGQQLDFSSVATAVGVTARTIKAWVSVLEASNQIFLLEPWFGNVGKRIVKTPKVYFADSGLVCWLLGIEATKLERSPFIGALWEGAVYAELRRQTVALGLNRTMYYYRDNEGTEVDFMVLGDGARLVEAKWTQLPGAGDVRNLKKLTALASASINPELERINSWIVARPTQAFPMDALGTAGVVGIDGIDRVLRAV